MDEAKSENLPADKGEKDMLRGLLSESLVLLEKLEADLIKRRNSRKKDFTTEEPTRRSKSISPNSSRECTSIMEEVKSTETSYVSKLNEHIAVYIYAIKHHESQEIKQHSVTVCNNLSDLLQLQVKFANILETTTQLEEMLKVFFQYENLFHTYKNFFMKDQKFHSIQIEASSSKNELKIDISLGAFLFQRLVQYKNLFEALQRVSTGTNTTKSIRKTLGVLSEILNECNKKLVLERIHLGPINESEFNFRPRTIVIGNCPLDHYNEYGTYYFENQFVESGKTVTLHLFSKVILVTKEKNGGQRIYQKHIKMTEVRLGPDRKNSKILVLEDYKKFKETGNLIVYEFEANFEEICIEWKRKIEEILQRQLHTWKSVVELKTRQSN